MQSSSNYFERSPQFQKQNSQTIEASPKIPKLIGTDQLNFDYANKLKKQNEELLKSLYPNTSNFTPENFSSPNKTLSVKEESLTPSIKSPSSIITPNKIAEKPSVKKTRTEDSKDNSRIISPNPSKFLIKEDEYFQYNDFNDYVKSMVEPIKKSDVKSKILELKKLGEVMKKITESESNEELDTILKDHLEEINIDQKPLYQSIHEAGIHYLKKSQIPDGVDSSKDQIRSAGKEMKIKNPNLVLSEKEVQSQQRNPQSDNVEALLNGLGIPISVLGGQSGDFSFSPDKNRYGNMSEMLNKSNTFLSPKRENLTELFPKESPITKNANNFSPGMYGSTQSQDQMSGAFANMQYFLSQNLKEIVELKEMMKQGDAPMSTVLQNVGKSDVLKLTEGFKSNKKEEDEKNLEKKIQDAQTERLVKKVSALNKKIEDLEKENAKFKGLNVSMKKCFKMGKVRMTQEQRHEADFEKMNLEDIENTFTFEEKFILLQPSSILVTPSQEQVEVIENQILLNEIEKIKFINSPGSQIFVIKLNDRESHPESRGSTSRKMTRANFIHFYLVEIEDPKEIPVWEISFFILNLRITLKSMNFSLNQTEFLSNIKTFLNKHQEFQGDPIRIFSASSEPLYFQSSKQSIKDSPRQDYSGDERDSSPYSKKRTNENSKFNEYMKKKSTNSDEDKNKSFMLDSARKINDEEQKLDEYLENSYHRETFSGPPPTYLQESAQNKEYLSRESLKDATSLVRIPSHESIPVSKKAEEEEDRQLHYYLKILTVGMTFRRHGNKAFGRTEDKLVQLSEDYGMITWRNPNKPRDKFEWVDFNMIVRIDEGSKSEFFAKKKKFPQATLDMSFTIVANNVELHLQAPDQNAFDSFVKALLYCLKEKEKVNALSLKVINAGRS